MLKLYGAEYNRFGHCKNKLRLTLHVICK